MIDIDVQNPEQVHFESSNVVFEYVVDEKLNGDLQELDLSFYDDLTLCLCSGSASSSGGAAG